MIILGIPTASVYSKSTASRFQVNLQLYDEQPDGTPVYLTQISLGVRDNPDTTQWHLLEGEFAILGWKIPPGHRLRVDWTSINQTLGDTSLWTIPYWNADGILTMGLDSEHPSSITIPIFTTTEIEEREFLRGTSHKSDVHVYPSLTAGYASIKVCADGSADVDVRIYNIMGRLVDYPLKNPSFVDVIPCDMTAENCPQAFISSV